MSVITTNSTRLISCIGRPILECYSSNKTIHLLLSSVYLIYRGITEYQRKVPIQDALLFYLSIKFFYTLFHVMTESIHAIDIL
jgi:hypothetical protein